MRKSVKLVFNKWVNKATGEALPADKSVPLEAGNFHGGTVFPADMVLDVEDMSYIAEGRGADAVPCFELHDVVSEDDGGKSVASTDGQAGMFYDTRGVARCTSCKRPFQYDESFQRGAPVKDCACVKQPPADGRMSTGTSKRTFWLTWDVRNSFTLWSQKPVWNITAEAFEGPGFEVKAYDGTLNSMWLFRTFFPTVKPCVACYEVGAHGWTVTEVDK